MCGIIVVNATKTIYVKMLGDDDNITYSWLQIASNDKIIDCCYVNVCYCVC